MCADFLLILGLFVVVVCALVLVFTIASVILSALILRPRKANDAVPDRVEMLPLPAPVEPEITILSDVSEVSTPATTPYKHKPLVRVLLYLSLLIILGFITLPTSTRALIQRQYISGEDTPFAVYLLIERLIPAVWVWCYGGTKEAQNTWWLKQYSVMSVLFSIIAVVCAVFNTWGAGANDFTQPMGSYLWLLFLENISVLLALAALVQFYPPRSVRSIELDRKRYELNSISWVLLCGCAQLLALTLLSMASVENGLFPFLDVVPREARVLVWYLLLRSIEFMVWLCLLLRADNALRQERVSE